MPGSALQQRNPLAGSSSSHAKMHYDTVIDTQDSTDSSQQGTVPSPASTSDSASHDPAKSPTETISFVCLWKECVVELNDPQLFFEHLIEHANIVLAGPCQWSGCSVTQHERNSRYQSNFMLHHVIQQHMPKKAFRCLMTGCNKAFDTAVSLNNHIGKHPQPKKNEKPYFVLDDTEAKQIREIPVESLGPPENYKNLQRSLKVQETLRFVGVSYVPISKEYFVAVHGLPLGDVKTKAEGIEQKYQLHFPYAPSWIKETQVRCIVADEINQNDVLLWRLPLSNPLFADQLRRFVKQAEKELVTSDLY